MSSDGHAKLMKQLGHTFSDESLLAKALRHRSMGKDNNERFEFLGDSVVNCVVASMLYEHFPQACEGGLSRLRAGLVNRDHLAVLAQRFALGEAMQLGSGELKSGGFRRASILADGFEAVVGSIWLDSDFATVERCVRQWYAQDFEGLCLDDMDKDGKTALQEWLQAKQMPLPSYQIDNIEGDAHDQTFYVSCQVDGFEHMTHGEGRSRRRAEQQAADAYLAWLQNEYS